MGTAFTRPLIADKNELAYDRGVSVVGSATLKIAVPLIRCFILTFQALSYYGNGTEAWRHSRGMTDRPALSLSLFLAEKLS